MVVIISLILMHIIGDFYLQTNKMASLKNGSDCIERKQIVNFKYLVLHSLLYAVPFVFLLFIVKWYFCLIILGILFFSHFLIDLFSCWLKRKTKKIFALLIDQSIHTIILYVLFNVFTFNSQIIMEYEKIIWATALILFIIKPSVIIVNHIFSDIFEEESRKVTENKKFDVGAIIGVFERMIVLLLSIFNAITAVAIIITVKTWARSKDIKDNENDLTEISEEITSGMEIFAVSSMSEVLEYALER